MTLALESSEREFAARYAEFAALGMLYPQQEGSPLLEFSAGGRVLYLFDRSGPYAAVPGEARVVVHGVIDLDSAQVLPPDGPHGEALAVLGVSGIEGVGRVIAAHRGAWVVQARLPLVLAAFEALPQARVGDWVSFRTLPPLHGFIVP